VPQVHTLVVVLRFPSALPHSGQSTAGTTGGVPSGCRHRAHGGFGTPAATYRWGSIPMESSRKPRFRPFGTSIAGSRIMRSDRVLLQLSASCNEVSRTGRG